MLGMHIEVVASDFSCLCFLLDSSSLCNLIFILHFLPHKFWLYCTFSHFGIYILAGKNCWNYCREEDGDCGERCFCFLPLEFLLYVKAVFICLWRQGGSRNGCFHRVTVLPNTHKVNLFFFSENAWWKKLHCLLLNKNHGGTFSLWLVRYYSWVFCPLRFIQCNLMIEMWII